jgi:hypothetical protein
MTGEIVIMERKAHGTCCTPRCGALWRLVGHRRPLGAGGSGRVYLPPVPAAGWRDDNLRRLKTLRKSAARALALQRVVLSEVGPRCGRRREKTCFRLGRNLQPALLAVTDIMAGVAAEPIADRLKVAE